LSPVHFTKRVDQLKMKKATQPQKEKNNMKERSQNFGTIATGKFMGKEKGLKSERSGSEWGVFGSTRVRGGTPKCGTCQKKGRGGL